MVDVVTHVRLGLEEVACCLLAAGTSQAAPDRDAATYWRLQPGGDDQVAGLLALRRIASATRRPTSALVPLRLVAGSLHRGVERLEEGVLEFQGCVLTTGDFLATWAVELALHQLDLGRDLDVPAPDPLPLALTRRTLEALLGAALPPADDVDAALLGAGRRTATEDERHLLGPAAGRLPVL